MSYTPRPPYSSLAGVLRGGWARFMGAIYGRGGDPPRLVFYLVLAKLSAVEVDV